jgi:hypothetical protein
MNIKILAPIILFTMVCSVAGFHNPIVIANDNSPDSNYAKTLMDSLYSHRDVAIINNNTVDVNESIFYIIPSLNEFSVSNNNEKLHVEFENNNNGTVKFNKIEYIVKIGMPGDVLSFLGNTYTVAEHTSSKIVLSKKAKEVYTNESFEYGDCKIVLKAMTFDTSDLMIDVYKNGKLIDKDVKLHSGDTEYLKDTDIAIQYENSSKSNGKNIFLFKVYDSLQLCDDDDFVLNKSFEVNVKDDRIILIYSHPENFKNSFKIFNYTVSLINVKGNVSNFKVTYRHNYNITSKDVDGTMCIGGNIYVVKKDDKLHIYKNGIEYNKTTEYIGSKVILKDNILESDGDIILIGGPISNSITKKIENKLIIPITNKNPGKDTGIIQKIKNPYNPNYYIYVLAGSDRYGTKACVLAFSEGYTNETVLKVKLQNNKPVIVNN